MTEGTDPHGETKKRRNTEKKEPWFDGRRKATLRLRQSAGCAGRPVELVFSVRLRCSVPPCKTVFSVRLCYLGSAKLRIRSPPRRPRSPPPDATATNCSPLIA